MHWFNDVYGITIKKHVNNTLHTNSNDLFHTAELTGTYE